MAFVYEHDVRVQDGDRPLSSKVIDTSSVLTLWGDTREKENRKS